MPNYKNLPITQLEALATERFGSLQSASLMAQRECELNESILRNKAPWVRAIERSLNPEDLGAIATHETWVNDVKENFRKESDHND